MNEEPRIDEESIAATDSRMDGKSARCCRPANALIVAIGAGLVIGLVVRALRPEPTRSERLAHLLADLEDRVRDSARPVLRRASLFATEGTGAVRDGLHTGEALLSRCWRDSARSVRSFFS